MINDSRPVVVPGNRVRSWLAGVLTVLIATGVVVATPRTASAATQVDLGAAEDFAVLGGAGVTNTGPTVVTGDLGTSPIASVTGFYPPGVVVGTIHPGDAVAAQAQIARAAAYTDASTQGPATGVPSQLGGTIKYPGIYAPNNAAGFNITGELTLDAQGDPDAVFIFQMESTLITAAGPLASRVTLINGAQACNVFWAVGSSATLGTYSVFAGNILAQAAIDADTGAVVDGRLLAGTESVTLDTNLVRRPTCGTVSPTATLTARCTPGRPGQITLIATVASGNPVRPTGPVRFFADGVSLGTAQLNANGQAFLTVSNLTPGLRRLVAAYAGTMMDPSASAVLSLRVGRAGVCPEIVRDKWIIVQRESEERDRPLQMQHQEQITEGVRSTSDQTDRAHFNVKSRRHGCHRRCHS
jgi:hypothetical protein